MEVNSAAQPQVPVLCETVTVTWVWGKAQANSTDSTDSTAVKGVRHKSRRGSDRQTNARMQGWEHPGKAAQRQINSLITQLPQYNVAQQHK